MGTDAGGTDGATVAMTTAAFPGDTATIRGITPGATSRGPGEEISIISQVATGATAEIRGIGTSELRRGKQIRPFGRSGLRGKSRFQWQRVTGAPRRRRRRGVKIPRK